jgi:hypothetical protein
MTIRVEGPGGVTIEFPDGTDGATIQGVMAKHFATLNKTAQPSPQHRVPGGLDGEIQPPQGEQPEARVGDFLKPYFGNRNPIAEVYDIAAPALDTSSDRPVVERIQDSVNFAASAPLQAFRLPSFGQIGESVIGDDTLRKSEERFVENNPGLLKGMAAVGEVAAGGSPLGQGFKMPPRPHAPPGRPQIVRQIGDDVKRARSAVDDMRSLDIEPFGPAVAAAKRGDNSGGAVTQALADKPIVGTPLQRGARQFVDDMVGAQDRIRQGYGQSQTMQGAGAQLRGYLDDFKEGRNLDLDAMDMAALKRVASEPPRLNTYKDVQSAKYAYAERSLPPEKAGAKPVRKGEKRDIGGLTETRSILENIKRRYGLTLNKSEAARAQKAAKSKASGELISLENTPDFMNPKWTGSANIDKSLDAIASSGGNWRAGLEGMREIRSNIRRALSAKGETEVNALARGDLKRLYSAISRDMDKHLSRLARDAETPELRNQFIEARRAYKDADSFTARYSQSFDELKTVFRANSDGAVMQNIKTAMTDGTKGNIRKLVELRRVAQKDVMDEVSSALIVDLGKPTGRAGAAAQEAGFSPSRFSSQWNSLSPQARKIVFGHRPQLHDALNRFARVSQNVADYEALANNSRTGVSNAVMAGVGAGGAAMVSPSALAALLGTILAGRSASSFLASPAYVNWLTRATVLSRNGNPRQVASHIQRLSKMTADNVALDPQTAQAIMLAANGVGDANNDGGR